MPLQQWLMSGVAQVLLDHGLKSMPVAILNKELLSTAPRRNGAMRNVVKFAVGTPTRCGSLGCQRVHSLCARPVSATGPKW